MTSENLTESQLIAFGYFERLADGRWAVDPKHPECASVEGLGAMQDPARSKSKLTSQCQLCSNWSPKVGCVLGYNLALDESRSQHNQLQVAEAQAKAWIEVQRFDRAITRLDAFLKSNNTNPAAYLALAKVYDHPGYQGKDKKRAVVLYQRYLELRGPAAIPDLESHRAEQRIQILGRTPVPDAARSGEFAVQPVARFACFYRHGGLTHFYTCVLTYDLLVLGYAGDADPDTGATSLQMGVGLEKASGLFRRIMGEKDALREKQLTRQELDRLSALTPTELARDNRANVWLFTNHIQHVVATEDVSRGVHSVTLWAGSAAHELLFPAAAKPQAEHVSAILTFMATAEVKQLLGPSKQTLIAGSEQKMFRAASKSP